MSYLSDAVQQLDRSEGDYGGDAAHRESLRMMAIASAMISIAQSLESITETLSLLREVAEHENLESA